MFKIKVKAANQKDKIQKSNDSYRGLILSSLIIRLIIHNLIIEDSKEKAAIIELKGQV